MTSELLASDEFWVFLDQLVASCKVVVDRPEGSTHPRYPSVVYPLDYGYLDGSTSGDGNEIDVWVGSLREKDVVGVAVTVDLEKLDSEIKILLGLTDREIQTIHRFHNEATQSAVILKRPVTGEVR